MRKILCLFAVGVFISILASCFSTEHYLIKDFNLFGVELTNPNEPIDEKKVFQITHDTLRQKLFFRIEALGKYEYGYFNNISLVEKCYATSVPEVLDNEIILEELELRFNSSIYFDGEIIEKGTDLWNHPKLKEYRWYFRHKNEGMHYNVTIGFIPSFYDKINIPQKDYVIELKCKTNDSLKMTKTLDVYLML